MKITNINDYMDDLQKRFPTIHKSTLKRICTYGFQMFHMMTKWGADINLQSNSLKFKFYSGEWRKKELQTKYRMIKNAIKHRILYKLHKKAWDGYYYIGFSEREYEQYLSQSGIGKKRRKKHFTFHDIYIYKLSEEVKYVSWYKYIIRFRYPNDCGFKLYNKSIYIKELELYLIRNKHTKQWEPINYEERK